jgi:hypothetical protein
MLPMVSRGWPKGFWREGGRPVRPMRDRGMLFHRRLRQTDDCRNVSPSRDATTDPETADISNLVGRASLRDALQSGAGYVSFRPSEISRQARAALFINGRGREAWLQSQHTDVQRVNELGAYFLVDAVIEGDCFVFYNGQFLLDGSGPNRIALQYALNAGRLGAQKRALSIVEVTEPALVIAGPGYPIWGHWLLDFLPRLAIARSLLGDLLERYIIPLPSDTPGWAFDIAHFFCGVQRRNFLLYDRSTQAVHCRNRVCMPTYAHSNYFFHSYLKEIYDPFIDHKHNSDLARICVSRRSFIESRSVARSFTQRDYFEETAKRRGYTLIRPENLDIRAQIDIYAGASIIVGEYGSGMHNALFSATNTIVGQFVMPNTIQSRIAGLRGHASVYLLPDSDPNFADPRPATMEVSEESIAEFFEVIDHLASTEGRSFPKSPVLCSRTAL